MPVLRLFPVLYLHETRPGTPGTSISDTDTNLPGRRLWRWCRAPASPYADGSGPGPPIRITLTQANLLLLLCSPDVATDFLILFFNAVIFSDFFFFTGAGHQDKG